MIKRISALLSVMIIALSSLVVFAPMIASAAVDTCTWTGATNSNMNNAGNWTGCDNTTTPEAGDALVFPYGAGVTNKTINNDFTAGTSFSSITFNGTAASESDYEITGNSITLTSGITNSVTSGGYIIHINVGITASSNLTFAIGNGLYFGDSDVTDKTIALGSNDLAVTGTSNITFYGPFTGSGDISLGTISSSIVGASPSFTGSYSTNGSLGMSSEGFGGAISIAGEGTLSFSICDGETANLDISTSGTTSDTYIPKISVYHEVDCGNPAGGGQGGGGGCEDGAFIPCDVIIGQSFYASAMPTSGSITLAGSLNLGSDTTLYSGAKDMKITSALTGANTLSLVPGGNTTLNLASTSNDSSTANGIYRPTRKVETVASSSIGTQIISGTGYLDLVLNGKRGDAYIYGGARIMGTGTVGQLKIDTDSYVAPGASPGCLKTGNLIEGGTYQVEIGGNTACSGYDQLQVTGTVNLTGGQIQPSFYNNFKPGIGKTYTVISNNGTDKVTGTFEGLAEAATFEADGYVMRISYVGGDGNDVTLSVVSVAGVPDTGLRFIMNNPGLTLGFAALSAGLLVVMSRKLRPAVKRVRR